MQEQITVLEKECEAQYAVAEQKTPDAILDWLEADDEMREMIKTATKIRKTHALFRAQEMWLTWRTENANIALEAAKLNEEDLQAVR